MNGRFHGGAFGLGGIRDAAHFNAEFEGIGGGGPSLPLHGETESGTSGGVAAEDVLVGVAVVEAGGEGGAALEIEKLGQDFIDSPLGRANG